MIAVTRQGVAFLVGVVATGVGAWLRINAKDVASPNLTSYSWSGPWENTVWGFKEQAYRELAWVLLIFGLVVLLIARINFLRTKSPPGQTRNPPLPIGATDE